MEPNPIPTIPPEDAPVDYQAMTRYFTGDDSYDATENPTTYVDPATPKLNQLLQLSGFAPTRRNRRKLQKALTKRAKQRGLVRD